MSRRSFTALLAAALTLALTFLVLPVVAIFVNVSPAELVRSLGNPVARDALLLSLRCTLIALALIVLVGTPAAYLLATRSFRGRAALITALELPLVLPPAVAGIGLLAAFGPRGVLGDTLAGAGITLPLSTTAVVLALCFVSSPFYLRQGLSAFAALDPSLAEASRTLGASEARTFLRVALPVAAPALGAGAVVAFGRALGEFGATLMFAGSLRGVSQTLPLAIYASFGDDFPAALAMSALLVIVSGALLGATKLASLRGGSPSDAPDPRTQAPLPARA
ncbi:MAG: molybdate ABC transporter permease subunit [Thermoleophilaceae bacterium]